MARLAERRKDLLASMMKDAIYNAAVVVLTQHGVAGTTMDRVAEEAEVAKGSLYNYFPSKLELLRFVHEKTVGPIRERSEAVVATDLPAVRKLETILRTWFEYIDERRGLFNFLFNDYAVRGLLQDQEETGHDSAIRDLTAIVEQGIEEQVFRRRDASRTAALLFGAVRQVVEQQLALDDGAPLSEGTGDLMDFFLHGLQADN